MLEAVTSYNMVRCIVYTDEASAILLGTGSEGACTLDGLVI